MSRNIRTEAIVLRTRRVGDIHKAVTLLTPEAGLIEAMAHGVYKGKGKLGGATDPFALSTAYLYYEPVKKNYKITDMECLDLFESVRGDLDRYYAASLWAEVIIRSYAGGEGAHRLFSLLEESLRALDGEADPSCVQIQFLWRFVVLSGFMPDIASCAICGRELGEREVALYRRSDGDFACSECLRTAPEEGVPDNPPLSAGARRYLVHTESLAFVEALKTNLEGTAKAGLLALMYAFVQDIVEVPLKTLQAGVL